MCFNLFGPLVNDDELATRLARALFGKQIRSVTRVVIEWAPDHHRARQNDEHRETKRGVAVAGMSPMPWLGRSDTILRFLRVRSLSDAAERRRVPQKTPGGMAMGGF